MSTTTKPRPANDPREEAALLASVRLLQALRALRDAHPFRCDCDRCEDCRGAAWGLRVFRDVLESDMHPSPNSAAVRESRRFDEADLDSTPPRRRR